MVYRNKLFSSAEVEELMSAENERQQLLFGMNVSKMIYSLTQKDLKVVHYDNT